MNVAWALKTAASRACHVWNVAFRRPRGTMKAPRIKISDTPDKQTNKPDLKFLGVLEEALKLKRE